MWHVGFSEWLNEMIWRKPSSVLCTFSAKLPDSQSATPPNTPAKISFSKHKRNHFILMLFLYLFLTLLFSASTLFPQIFILCMCRLDLPKIPALLMNTFAPADWLFTVFLLVIQNLFGFDPWDIGFIVCSRRSQFKLQGIRNKVKIHSKVVSMTQCVM